MPEYSGTSSGQRPRWTWIHGLRIERPSDQGLIVAPRVNLKWAPASNLDVRFNAGRGYRRVHLFTEEHAALDGSRNVIQPATGLDPESSWNALLAADWQTGGPRASMTVSARAFSTVFTDRIYADYDSLPNTILYRNIDGTGWSRGIGLDLQWMHSSGWRACWPGPPSNPRLSMPRAPHGPMQAGKPPHSPRICPGLDGQPVVRPSRATTGESTCKAKPWGR